MRIAFHAPMKPPDHPVPSGDREMARLLMRALGLAGHEVRLASRLRAFSRDPSASARSEAIERAATERDRLLADWLHPGSGWRPDLWFTYHLYYKAPDRLGPGISRRLAIPYVTAEASYAGKRDRDGWAPWQGEIVDAVRAAALNICFTARDREGLERIPGRLGALADLAPFIDPDDLTGGGPEPHTGGPLRLVTVAMMRPGDKLDSYHMLAKASDRLGGLDWTLTVIGDGPCRGDVVQAFAALPQGRVTWLGEQPRARLGEVLGQSDVFVWPGFGEAFGLAYLEAQCLGLPVVAQRIAGVPEVVRDGVTGLLTPPGDVEAFAGAIRALAMAPGRRAAMSAAARRFVREERSIAGAARRLRHMLAPLAPARGGE